MTNELNEQTSQLELALNHVRAELTHQRSSLKEFKEVTVSDFRARGMMGELLEGFTESIRKWEIAERTLVELLGQENGSAGG